MPGTISIRRLKHIQQLDFDVPGPGVHLLAGVNGSGKSSVLACLRRIGQSNAFAHHFAASQRSDVLDGFEGAEITYALNQNSVTYSYGGKRWVPRPRNQNKLLAQFGYPEVFYIGATAERITPRPEDFQPRYVRAVAQDIKDAANRILSTKRFDALRTVNLTRGAGNPAFVLQVTPPPRATYVSERNFSLGELCVLKLVRSLRDCANNSLVLIDELELALHPRAQIELFKYLKEIAAAKQLTVIFSTHSPSLLKHVPRKRILFLENNGGTVNTVKGCYPAYALGSIAYDEERAPDAVIYVEDDSAMYVTDALVRLFLVDRFSQQQVLTPTVHVVPVGPFLNVVRFLGRANALLPPTTQMCALLDQDVRAENVAQWQASGNHAMLAEFQQHGQKIDYLPWTPEVALINFLRDPAVNAERRIRERLGDNRINLRPEDFGVVPPAAGAEQRHACKAAVARISAHIAALLPNSDAVTVKKILFELLAQWYFTANRGAVSALLAPRIT